MFMQSQYRMVRERRTFLKQMRSATTIQSFARGNQVCPTNMLLSLHCLLSRPPEAISVQAPALQKRSNDLPCN